MIRPRISAGGEDAHPVASGVGVSWQPLVDGAVRGRALAVARELGEAFAKAPIAPEDEGWRDAEAALLYHYLSLQWPDAGYAAEAAAAVERIFASISRLCLPPSLLGGFVGIAWVVQHLDPTSVYDTGEDPLSEIDELLLASLTHRDWTGRVDLAGGLAGIGAYALERGHRGASIQILEQVVERLWTYARWSEQGATWWTPPHRLSPENAALHPRGHFDLGIPHGAAGIILVLAAATNMLEGPWRARAVLLVESAVRWLLSRRLPSASVACFPKWVAPHEEPSAGRTAWCYGDAGIGSALLSSARQLDHTEWEGIARDVLHRCAVRTYEDTGVVDATFCHGAAGITHLLNRSFQVAQAPALGQAARSWFERMLNMRRPGEGLAGFARIGLDPSGQRYVSNADAGLVSGITGIALTLLAGASRIEPGWDRLLLPRSL